MIRLFLSLLSSFGVGFCGACLGLSVGSAAFAGLVAGLLTIRR